MKLSASRKRRICKILFWLWPLMLLNQIPAVGLLFCWGGEGHLAIETAVADHHCHETDAFYPPDPQAVWRTFGTTDTACGCWDIGLVYTQFPPFVSTGASAYLCECLIPLWFPSPCLIPQTNDRDEYRRTVRERAIPPLVSLQSVILLM